MGLIVFNFHINGHSRLSATKSKSAMELVWMHSIDRLHLKLSTSQQQGPILTSYLAFIIQSKKIALRMPQLILWNKKQKTFMCRFLRISNSKVDVRVLY